MFLFIHKFFNKHMGLITPVLITKELHRLLADIKPGSGWAEVSFKITEDELKMPLSEFSARLLSPIAAFIRENLHAVAGSPEGKINNALAWTVYEGKKITFCGGNKNNVIIYFYS